MLLKLSKIPWPNIVDQADMIFVLFVSQSHLEIKQYLNGINQEFNKEIIYKDVGRV